MEKMLFFNFEHPLKPCSIKNVTFWIFKFFIPSPIMSFVYFTERKFLQEITGPKNDSCCVTAILRLEENSSLAKELCCSRVVFSLIFTYVEFNGRWYASNRFQMRVFAGLEIANYDLKSHHQLTSTHF